MLTQKKQKLPARIIDNVAVAWSMIPHKSHGQICSRAQQFRDVVFQVRRGGWTTTKTLSTLRELPPRDFVRWSLESKIEKLHAAVNDVFEDEDASLTATTLDLKAAADAVECFGMIILLDYLRKHLDKAQARNLSDLIQSVRSIELLDRQQQLSGCYLLHFCRCAVEFSEAEVTTVRSLFLVSPDNFIERIAEVLRAECHHLPVFPAFIQEAIERLDRLDFANSNQFFEEARPSKLTVDVVAGESTICWNGTTYEVSDQAAALFRVLLRQTDWITFEKSKRKKDAPLSAQQQDELLAGAKLSRILKELLKINEPLAKLVQSEKGAGIRLKLD